MSWGLGNSVTIGTCSLCGGEVTMPKAWWSVVPAKPTCEQCGAVKRASGPVIDMQPPTQAEVRSS